MNYIWQHKHWPKFSYDSSKLSALAYQYAKQAAQLSGSLAHTDLDDSIAAQLDLMVDEAINTSLIEGENLNPTSVRSSLQNHRGDCPQTSRPVLADVRIKGLQLTTVKKTLSAHPVNYLEPQISNLRLMTLLTSTTLPTHPPSSTASSRLNFARLYTIHPNRRSATLIYPVETIKLLTIYKLTAPLFSLGIQHDFSH